MNFTPEQYAAIHAENAELLVSASAGTGKTEVLCERIVDMIVNRGFSVDRMAIVTFTRAAAQEMRSRIGKKLMAAAELDPRLRRQCDLVPLAQISTIDSLCQRIVRSHFEAVGMDPSYSVLTGAEGEKLRRQSLDEAMERFYEQAKQDEELAALAEGFEDEEICGMVEALYPFLMARPDPLGTLKECSEAVYTEENLDEQPFAVYQVEEGAHLIDSALELWSGAVQMLETGALDQRYAGNVHQDGITLSELKAARAGGYRHFMERYANVSWMRKASVRKDKAGNPPLGGEEFSALRKQYTGLISGFAEKLPRDILGMIADLNHAQKALRGLYKLMADYFDCYRKRKDRRHVADFADVQSMALSILKDEKLRDDVTSAYDAVFVDEYQDVSMAQEELLRLLCRKGGNAFYVGDVKQSIYRFRQAEPALFLQKLNGFTVLTDAPQRKIFLRDNFRSVSTVQHSVNRVFTHLMRSEVTEIDYDEDAMLRRPTESRGDVPFSIHVLPEAKTPSGGNGDRIIEQATWIASDLLERIGKPLGEGGDPLRFGDALILMPVGKNVLSKVEMVMRGLGIPVDVQGGGNAAASPEIVQIVCALECFTNCRNDYALLATLRSPLLRFQERELCEIRLCLPERERSFFEALEAAAEQAEEPLRRKCRNALEVMERERELMRCLPLDRYLWDFLRRSGYYLYVAKQPNGQQARANLSWLCERALEWEDNGGGGAAAFARLLREEAGQKEGAAPTAVSLGENAVRLMTIHKSKGLGARLVYVMNLEHRLRSGGREGSLAFHNRLGISLEYRNRSTKTRRKTVLQEAIKALNDSAERAEKTRLLYVAMTRAKEGLILVGSSAKLVNDPAELEKRQKQQNMVGVKSALSYLDWVCQCAADGDEAIWEEYSEDSPAEEAISPQEWVKISTNEPVETSFPHMEKLDFHNISTCFPRKTIDFHFVFHKNSISYETLWKKTHQAQPSAVEKPVEKTVEILDTEARPKVTLSDLIGRCELPDGIPPFDAQGSPDPLLPSMPSAPVLHKIGVTKLIAARQASAEEAKPRVSLVKVYPSKRTDSPADGEGEPLPELPETLQDKRLPIDEVLPAPQEDMRLPAFLMEQPDAARQRAARVGTVTHIVLELLDLDAARNDHGNTDDFVREQLRLMVKRCILSPEEAALVRPEAIADFLCSPLGQRMLRSERVEREFSFTLRTSQEDNTLVQGIIDLCFLEDGGWVLVDFKTDFVHRAEELLPRYAEQIAYYRKALELGTDYPVREALLYAVRLGRSVSVPILDLQGSPLS